jgi:signal transduction histidine kinase
MLRAGWGSEEQKRGYYDYIHDESERLSRLINNVLQLARMNRNETPLALKPVTGAELMDSIPLEGERADRACGLRPRACAASRVASARSCRPISDAVLQIVINLVDNAIKFSAKAAQKRIEIVCRPLHSTRPWLLSVRDYRARRAQGIRRAGSSSSSTARRTS